MTEPPAPADLFRGSASAEFWLRELRTPELLIEVAQIHGGEARKLAAERAAVAIALTQDREAVEAALGLEENVERRRDRLWWLPLRAELEQFRRECRKQ